MKFDPEKHHRRSIRLKGYDYSKAGWYFVTICTHNREPLLGNVVDGDMVLNELGKIVTSEWLITGKIRTNIDLDKFVVMPNHIHGIIVIVNDELRRGTKHRAPTMERFGKPTSNTIPTVIRGFKSAVTKKINIIRQSSGTPVWQHNYYEHIIRNEPELNRIRQYIMENPLKWQGDKYYTVHIK